MRRGFRAALVLVSSAALLLGGTQAGVAASPATKAPPGTQRACGLPAAGMMACLALLRGDSIGTAALAAPLAAPAGLGPADLRDAYKLASAASSAGSGVVVAIVDAFDDPNAEADLGTYRTQFGLSPCTTANGCFRKVNQNGQASPLPSADAGWAAEISLDVDMVSAICPNCRILLVEANSNSGADLFGSVNTAVNLGARFVSNSFGGGEFPTETSADTQFYDHPGVVITASSGDSGFGVLYPAASRFVTSVGGTSLTRSSSARGWSETAWSGAGSGCSRYERQPAFQTRVSTRCSRRAVADVSAIADPSTGVSVFDSFQQAGWLVFGGTSVSAPIVASVYALAGTPSAGSTPGSFPYDHTSSLFDVTSGSNGRCRTAVLCTAGAGWDGPTGLGTPNGTAAFVG
jgi:subtilase family serine protease